jgi:hypothetical protein
MLIKRLSYCLLLLLFVIPVAANFYVNSERFRHLITDSVETYTGKTFAMSRLRVGWSLSPVIVLENVTLSNAEWGSYEHAFASDRISVKLSLASLLRSRIQITDIELKQPVLNIEKSVETGFVNLALGKGGGMESSSDLDLDLIIERVSVRNGKIFYLSDDKVWEFGVRSLTLDSVANDLPIRGNVQGTIQGTAVSLSGTLGSLAAVLENREIAVDLDGSVGGKHNHLGVSGVISSVRTWRGLNLWVDATMKHIEDLGSILTVKVPEGARISDLAGRWELVQPDAADTLRLESLNLVGNVYGLDVLVTGGIGQLAGWNEIDLEFAAKGTPEIQQLRDFVSSDARISAELGGTIKGNKQNLLLDLAESRMVTNGAVLHISGNTGNLTKEWDDKLELMLELDSFESINPKIPDEIALFFPLVIKSRLHRASTGFNLTEITTETGHGNALLNVSGEILNIGPDRKGRLLIEAHHDENILGFLNRERLSELVDRISLNGRLEVFGNHYSFPELLIVGQAAGVMVSGKGSIDNILEIRGLAMDIQGKIDELEILNDLLSMELPKTGQVEFSASLFDHSDGKLRLGEIQVSTSGPGIDMNINGLVHDPGPFSKVELGFKGNIHDGNFLGSMFPEWVRPDVYDSFLPVIVAGNIQGEMEEGEFQKVSMTGFRATSIAGPLRVHVSGNLENMFHETRSGLFETRVVGVLPGEASQIRQDLFALFQDYPVDLEGDLDVFLQIQLSGDGAAVRNIDASLKNENSSVRASGDILQLAPLKTENLKIELQTSELRNLIKTDDSPFKPELPGRLTVLFDSPQNALIELSIGNSDLSGGINFKPGAQTSSDSADDASSDSAELIRLNGAFTSKNLDLTELLIDTEDKDSVLSSVPLDLKWIDQFKGEIILEIENFRNSIFNLQNVRAIGDIAHKRFEVYAVGQSPKGSLGMNLDFTKIDDGFSVGLILNAEDVDVSALNKAITRPDGNNGIFTMQLDLRGNGRSFSEIAGQSNGDILFQISDARLKSHGLQLASKDFFSIVLTSINPLVKQSDLLDVDCGVLHFNVDDGKAAAAQGLALKTRDFTLLGGGHINFSDESIRFLISSKARKGFGINTNTFAKMVHVEGTLSKPEIQAGKEGLLQTGAALGAAYFSGGLSILAQGLYDKRQANSDVCQLVLTETRPSPVIKIPESEKK